MGLLDAVSGLFGSKKQDFLEADPYWDQSTVPINTYKNKSPFTAKVISTKRIVGPQVHAAPALPTRNRAFAASLCSAPSEQRHSRVAISRTVVVCSSAIDS